MASGLFGVTKVSAAAKIDTLIADSEGVEQLGHFWIAGSVEALDRRAARERSGHGPIPVWLEIGVALAIAAGAIAWVVTAI